MTQLRKLAILGLTTLLACSDDDVTVPAIPQFSESAVELQQLVDDEVTTQNSTFTSFGMAVTVYSNERGGWTGVGGVSHEDVAISPDMVFVAASITKTFVAALALQLQEEGVFSLDDPISKWLDNINVVDDKATIRQLLDHSAGVFNYAENPGYVPALLADPGREWTPEEVLATLVEDPYFEPGTGWSYSNTGYVIVRMIIQKATGNSLTAELRNRFFTRLGLNNTYFNLESYPNQLAHIWDDPFGTGEYTDFIAQGLPLQAYLSLGAAPGSVISTSSDLARWGTLLYGGEVLQSSSLEEMQLVNPMSFVDEANPKYGLGTWEYNLNGRIMYGHGGTKSHRSLLVYYPVGEYSIAITTNRPDFDVFTFLERIINVIETLI